MAQFEKHFVQDLTQDIKIRQCGTIVFNADNLSNVISVELYNGTEPYSGGGTVAGAVICPDGATVSLTGTLSGNVASVTLTGDCFAIPGQIGVGVQVISESVRTTVLKAIYNVELLSTDNMVDPDSRITASVTQLVADIEAATAEIPASDMASLMSGISPTFRASTNYAAGAYVYYNGTLYKFTSAHAAGSWTGTDVVQVALGNDVADLKSAVSPLFPENEVTSSFLSGKYYDSTLTLQDNTSSSYSLGIPCKGYTRVIVSTPNMLTSNSTRCMGFKKNGVVSGVYTIQSLVSRCTQVGDHYETRLDIGDSDTFYMSIQSANAPINVKLTPAISAEVLDAIKPTTLYVDSTNGSDNNTGATRGTALASIQKAIDLGGKTILVKEGSYAPFSMLEKSDVLISVDPYYSAYTAGTDEDDPKIVIDGAWLTTKIGVEMNRCNKCVIKNVEVKNFTSMGFRVYRCSACRYIDCAAHDIGLSGSESVRNGYTIQYSDADFDNCIAYNIGTTSMGTGSAHYDGFNVHYTGTVNLINCSAWNCEDDGVSHHDACCGYINGGEFFNCGKGGVASPTHGAKINVYGVYSHDNENGLYCDNASAVTDRGNILISNCVFKNNVVDVLVGDYYSVIATNCVYDTVSGAENITVFNVT